MRKRLKTPCRSILTILFFWSLACGSAQAVMADKENCLMCHKYPYLGRIDENGLRHSYHVDPALFTHSVHRNVGCRECHTTIRRIPHDPITQPVDCATVCHVQPPFSDEKFSHRRIVDLFNTSIHAAKPDMPPEKQRALPNCKYCHMNPLLERLPEEAISYSETLRRCFNCHETQGVIQAYSHVTHRLRKKTTRSPAEIIQLCADCHADPALLAPFDLSAKALTAVATYNRSIHGKAIMLGSQRTADCISCHASSALHDIYTKENPRATIHADNLKQTCLQCHEQTNSFFVKVAVHPQSGREENPLIYFLNIMLRLAMYGTIGGLMGLLLLETIGRRRHGIRFLLRNGSSWRRRKS
jgi:nitrate/TMAO reductase-like tetraheme cytochrome c subunit